MIVESQSVIAGRYRLREQLGRGGMSVVWRADDEVLGREVAVKVLSPALASDPLLRRQIHDEARTAARLHHPAVVAVHDYGEFLDAGRLSSYVVMELVDGRTLADMLTAGSLPWKVAVLVGAQVAAALSAAHAAGIVHRDVKPANVMVTSVGVKLVDFGISAIVGAVDGQKGQILGTPAYLAPERIRGAPVRPATDVYALGLLLYLALCGRMPWDASTVTQMVRAHVYARPAPLPAVPGLPAPVVQLVTRCLAKDPADRPSAIEVAERLGEIAGLPSSRVMRSAVATPTLNLTGPAVRRPRRGLLAAAAAVVLMTGGGLWWNLATPADTLAATGSETSCPATCPGSAGVSATPATTAPSTAPTTSPPVKAVTVRTTATARPDSRPRRTTGTGTPARRPALNPPKPKAAPVTAPHPKKPKKAKKPKSGHGRR
ncbi:serine/threonine-protein kinase [Actinoplanes palleronii]|nr:serine/threonine-protein kinase [Actinoplanes palleronii]